MPKIRGVFNPEAIQVILRPTVIAIYKFSFMADAENFTPTIPLAMRFTFSFAVQ
jgi:hypothetical protein